MKELKVKLTFTEEILGTSSSDPELFKNFISQNAPSSISKAEEDAIIESLDEQAAGGERPVTVFPRDEDGNPMFWDYQIKGFFKDTCSALRKVPKTESNKIKAYKKEIDGLIFINERRIPLIFEGEMGSCQRPLRASTPQGDRVALACSETVPAGATCVFTVKCFCDDHIKAVKEWLDFGVNRGMGQWRNSGKGRFTYEVLDEQ